MTEINRYSYYSTLALMTGVMIMFVTAPIVGVPSFGAFVISFGLAIIAAILLLGYVSRFSPEPTE